MATLAPPPVSGPSWDAQIVPTLRKRLEAESRMLTKRMSMISISSDDNRLPPADYSQPSSPVPGRYARPETPQLHAARASAAATRPSAIPRPSHRTGPPDSPSPMNPGSRANLGNGYPSSQPVRQRTLSTPGLAAGIPTPAASRSNSPMVALNGKPSRIPTPTASSKLSLPSVVAAPPVPHMPNGSRKPSGPSQTSFPPSPETSPDLLPVSQGPRTAGNSSSSFEPIGTGSFPASNYTKPNTDLIHEPAPFDSAASGSDARLSFSNDDGERPFEHWYRGESRRNGGVGEVRVARRDEMMEIATYGHRIGSAAPQMLAPYNNGGRRRAGSFSQRGSWYDDQGHQGHPQVLDEQPLTDIDGVSDFSQSGASRPTTPKHNVLPKASTYYSTEEDNEATLQWRHIEHQQQQYQQQQQQQAPAASYERPRQASKTSQHSSSAHDASATSHQGSGPRSSPVQQPNAASRSQQSRQQPPRKQTGPMSPAQKIAASASAPARNNRPPPAKAPAPAAKRTQGPPPRSRSAPGKNVASRSDEGIQYEMDAIPTWTQPKTGGNWDDVVIPAVAKKMGIQDGYEQEIGTPKAPRKRESQDRIEPAPGTFGFDYTKYGKARIGGVREMGLDDFGRSGSDTDGQRSDDKPQVQTEPIVPRPITPAVRRPTAEVLPPPSPAPFSAYQLHPSRQHSQQQLPPPSPQRMHPDPQVVAEQKRVQEHLYAVDNKKEEESGCCGGCVVM